MTSFIHKLFNIGDRAVSVFRISLAIALSLAIASASAQFGDGTGLVKIPTATATASAEYGDAIALQPDGKIVIAGRCLEGLCVLRLNADGSIDTTFNSGGPYPGKAVIPSLNNVGTASGFFARLVVDQQGRIMVATTCFVAVRLNNFCIARLTANGSLDASFMGPAGTSAGSFNIDVNGNDSQLTALHLAQWTTSTGEQRRRLLLGGYCGIFQCIAALDPETGALDNSFDPPNSALPNGVFAWLISPSSNDYVGGIVSQSGIDNNGKIVVASTCRVRGRTSVCLTKFNVDGSFDSDFRGPSGTANGTFILYALPQGTGQTIPEKTIDLREANDGRYYLLCEHEGENTCLYRLNRDGSLDQSFDNGAPFPTIKGRIVYSARAGFDSPIRLGVDRTIDGLLSAPVSLTECGGPCLARFRGTGPIDTSLTGPNGDAAGVFSFDPGPFDNDFVADMAVNELGEILVVGNCNGRICVIKFKQSGSLFTSECRRDVDGDGQVSAASDGMAIVRSMRGYTGALVIPKGLGYDIDGDGALKPERDGLLLLRRMLGFDGDGVMNGITF
ncbi:MAG: delta-60 repeat domain-containing protein, partial [Casimicrobium sp.]